MDSTQHFDGKRSGGPAPCAEARALLELYAEAVEQVLLLQQMQFRDVVAGDGSALRFDLLIHDANEKKSNAKYAYLTHLHVHGCATDLNSATQDTDAESAQNTPPADNKTFGSGSA